MSWLAGRRAGQVSWRDTRPVPAEAVDGRDAGDGPARPARARRALMAALAMGAATLPACFVPSLSAAPCSGVSPDTVAAIEDRVTVDGRLRHPFAYTSEESGVTFVSAELHMATDEPEDAGDILTWAATDGSLRSFAAVDEQARKKSAWPTAEEMDAKTHGVIISRGCTHTLRGQVICETQTGEQIAGVEAECPDEEED